MTKQVQRRRGTSTQHTSFTGAEGEISVNTTNKSVHVHDGSTAGGVEAARADLTNVSDANLNAALAGNTLSSLTITSVDINGGNIDGTVIGGSTPAAISGTTITGTSFVTTGDMTFGDNDKAIFGAGSDLQIYHDASLGQSRIQDVGTGSLYLQGDGGVVITNSAGTSTSATFASTGATSLSYNGTTKFATTGTGIDVTGTVTADGLTLANNTYVKQNDAAAGVPRILGINSGNTTYIGPIDAYAGGAILYGVSANVTQHSFFTATDARMLIASNGDISFYEDTGTTPKFFWDASTERLGIGNAAPTTALDVTGTIMADGLTVDGDISSTGGDLNLDTLDLNAIAASKAVTAVDVFVYDTSKDSDGGAWRKRTQGTSWYNETLNTATRGSRREFPAVAVIVAEAGKVTIYDGDDPALPMWMVFNGGVGNFLQSPSNMSCVAFASGLLCVGATADFRLTTINFLSDTGENFSSTNSRIYSGVIASRNSGVNALINAITSRAIVNQTVNDVAMTVLPDAPIDPATGLPVPTIAVATAGGVSVIKDDGTVVDSAAATVSSVSIDEEKLSYVRVDECRVISLDNIVSDGFTYDRRYNTGPTYSASFLPQPLSGSNKPLIADDVSFAASLGLTRLYENTSSQTKGMVAYTTSKYNTGWMNGDIKGAFLSDTDDTDLVGSGELVTNGTFDTDTDWTKGAGWTIAAGVASFSNPSGTLLSQAVSTIPAGSVIAVTFDKTGAGNIDFRLSGGGGSDVSTIISGAGTFTVYVVATVNRSTVNFLGYQPGGYSIDNVSVKLADADRSVNNKGLIVNGTVTRTPVATGADLVAYSGFSASNYLEQPYNSALDFGTGDFCVMGWIKEAANSAVETILERDSAVTAQRFTLAVNASGFLTFTCDDDTTARTATSNRVVDNDVWTHFVALYDGAGDVKIYLNGVLDDTETGSALLTLNNASAVLRVGLAVDDAEPLANADLALLRISATVPSDSQIEKIYNDEKFLFQENAQATLFGASDAVTALAHDPVTDLLHVGTSAGRSVFSGLRRVSNTTTAVGTAISASNGLVVEE